MPSKYFKEEEFQGWYSLLDPRLIPMLDQFREEWGAPVRISKAIGAVGRRMSLSEKSMHNVTRWKMVKAVDIMPVGLKAKADFLRAFNLAKKIGFTGIGLYPDWVPQGGLHVDVRPDRVAGSPATWSAFKVNGKQEYFGVDKVIG